MPTRHVMYLTALENTAYPKHKTFLFCASDRLFNVFVFLPGILGEIATAGYCTFVIGGVLCCTPSPQKRDRNKRKEKGKKKSTASLSTNCDFTNILYISEKHSVTSPPPSPPGINDAGAPWRVP